MNVAVSLFFRDKTIGILNSLIVIMSILKMNDNLHIGEQGRNRMIAGIKKVSDAVKSTMGTGGANALIEVIENPQHLLTNDGWTIANSIKLVDPLEEMGRRVLLEAINRANKQSGDGSSTTCLLTSSILEEGIKHIGEASPMDIKKSLEDCIPLVEASLNAQKREITVDTVGQVATISAEDEKIGGMIQEIYQKIGKHGIIYWDISKTFEDHYTIGTGISIDGAGFASPYMADIDEKTGHFLNVARWKNPHILITKQKISSAADFNDLFQGLFNKEIKEIVVFCDEYEAPVIGDLIRTRAIRGFKTLLVKMPLLWKDWWYEDLAYASGATVIDPALGLTFKNVKLEHLGRVDNLVVTKDDTFIDGIKDVSDRVKELQEEKTEDSLLRAARLNTRTARYFVGAPSESALSYKRLKVEDAISAGWQALQNGVVAGGGSALVVATDSLPEAIGGKILKTVLTSPARQIALNAGYDKMVIGDDYKNGRGFDSKKKEFVDMYEAGILDPANVVLNAVRNAISVAASVLTCNVIIEFPKMQAEEPKMPV